MTDEHGHIHHTRTIGFRWKGDQHVTEKSTIEVYSDEAKLTDKFFSGFMTETSHQASHSTS